MSEGVGLFLGGGVVVVVDDLFYSISIFGLFARPRSSSLPSFFPFFSCGGDGGLVLISPSLNRKTDTHPKREPTKKKRE